MGFVSSQKKFMRVLVAGATGLIGRPLVQALLNRGDEVYYLTTDKNKCQTIAGATGFYWEPEKYKYPEKALVGVSVVINLAGASVSLPWTKKRKQQILKSRLNTAKTLEQAIASQAIRPKQYISASGISGYASAQALKYKDQDEILGKSFLAEVVRKWEAAVVPFEDLDIKTTRVRTGLVLAKTGGVLPQIVSPVRLGLGSVIGTGLQHISWIHMDDLVAIYLWIIDNQKTNSINAVAPYPVTHQEMMQIIAKTLRRPLWLPKVPAWLLRIILGERSDLVLDSQWVIPEILTREKFKFKYSKLEAALSDLLL